MFGIRSVTEHGREISKNAGTELHEVMPRRGAGAEILDGVLAEATGKHEGVGATLTGQGVFSAVAGNDIVQCIAGTFNPARSGQCQVFDRAKGLIRVGKTEGDSGEDRVCPVAAGLVGDIFFVIDDIAVVAKSAKQTIGALA